MALFDPVARMCSSLLLPMGKKMWSDFVKTLSISPSFTTIREDVLVVSTLGHHLAVSVNNPPSSTRLIASAQHLPNALVSWATVMASVI